MNCNKIALLQQFKVLPYYQGIMQDIQQLNTLCFLETTDFKLLQQILSDLFAMKAKTNVQVAELLARSSPKGSAKVGNIEDSGMFNLPRKVCRRNPRSSPGKEEKQDKQMPLLIY